MDNQSLAKKYCDKTYGVLNCYDRIILNGTLPLLCYAEGMTSHLKAHHIRIFDYSKFAAPLRDEIRTNAEALAKANDLQIEFIRKKTFRKEKRIKEIIKTRGAHPGLVHIFSAMEPCTSYKPWHDKQTGKTFLKYDSGKCLHYYFYFIDDELGLCYVRVPTWCPFRLQFYFNGHALLAFQLQRKGISYELQDNAFLMIADFEKANQLSERLNIEKLHRKLDGFAKRYCSVITSLKVAYHWSIMQAEYATDIVFKRQQDLQAIYPHLLETLIHSVKPENIATFLGQKLHGNYTGEMGNRFNVRILGSRIKHLMGPVSIKMYDKFGIILRIETTVDDVSFFQEYRDVRHRTGERETKWTKMRKTIYNLQPLHKLLQAANHRYLDFVSQIETSTVGVKLLSALTHTKIKNDHCYKGFNILADETACLWRALLRGEWMISGFTRMKIQRFLSDKTPGQMSRLLKRLRVHGIIRKVGNRYKYYLTQVGRRIATMALKLRELYVIPALARQLAP